jgi:tetratricopeptide (TPR) repeat protein
MNAIGSPAMRNWPIYTGWATAATAHGFAAINVETRAGSVDADLDALAAYLRGHAADLNVDPDRIAVYAASANASAGLPIIQDPNRAWIKAAAIYYGAGSVENYRSDIPLLWVRAGLDNALLNRMIDEAAARSVRQNVTASVINYPGGRHGFESLDDTETTRDVIGQTFQFFRKSLDPSWRAAMSAGRLGADAAGAAFLGDYERAVSLYSQIVDEKATANLRLLYGNALLGARRYKDARAQFDRAKQLGGLGPRDLGVPAAIACALDGDGDAAIAWINGIPKQYRPASLQQEAAFEKLRGRSDFQELFR